MGKATETVMPAVKSEKTIAIEAAAATGPQLLTCNEAAKLLRWHPFTVERKARANEIPHIRLSARGLRFDRRVLEAWIESKAVPR